jgi:hypothetical protein
LNGNDDDRYPGRQQRKIDLKDAAALTRDKGAA